MLQLTAAQVKRALIILVSFHIIVITASNYLVQLPFQIFGLHTTWGAFSFPFVYLATDLTVRIFGAPSARKIIFGAMMPALLASYVISVLFFEGQFQGGEGLLSFNTFVARIAFASFAAYLFGQLMDIKVFARLRQTQQWWVAPAASTIFGNLIDTLVFFSVAFYASSDPFMASHWPEIASVDYGFKLLISLGLFLPAYGVLLKFLSDRILLSDNSIPRTLA
ncbi:MULTISPECIES: 7-cyano-7-deazaguanine/7-aminomethyl-7-deazaguanine transporter [Ferrimonas]|uniref:7-cyano-7-deazaguanine/7-aminomethyl-7- deazaguanine transporter n=1 Tax=Ferrimonas TaxID=44011 RepID=UPI0004064818|nr:MULTISPECIES: 7-cyano-7-deazaguanine/7-aminomethyl-7-deazaguanine transporter [Ferrimonas]USD37443.1 7-cyano-7-deazaguanine/7-aminomethyl-7-deazaguanine transporter [Ferrimonas sp. SCSIO 43195]